MLKIIILPERGAEGGPPIRLFSIPLLRAKPWEFFFGCFLLYSCISSYDVKNIYFENAYFSPQGPFNFSRRLIPFCSSRFVSYSASQRLTARASIRVRRYSITLQMSRLNQNGIKRQLKLKGPCGLKYAFSK